MSRNTLRMAPARAAAGSLASRPFRASKPPWLLSARHKVPAVISGIPVLYMCFFSAFRDDATIALAVAVGFAVVVHMIARRVYIGPFIPMIAVSSVYVYLSYNQMLPSAWTTYFNRNFILRQWMWVPLLALFSSTFCIFFLHHREFIKRHALVLCLFAIFFGRLSLFLSPLSLSFIVKSTIYTLTPENSTFFVVFIVWLFSLRRITPEAGFFVVGVIALCSSTQSLLLAVASVGIRYTGYGRAAVLGLMAIIGAAMLIAPNYSSELYNIDTSSGFRAVLWRDATDAFTQSNGLGVGFGTEYFRNKFEFDGIPDWQAASEDTDNRLLIGTHNSAFDIALRMGVPGLLALLYFAWSIGSQTLRLRERDPDRDLNCAVLFMLVLNNGLNMGVASINFMMTTALATGWIMASNARNTDRNSQRQRVVQADQGGPKRAKLPARLAQ